MSFWRKEVIDFALDHETRLHMEEQLAWIAREPGNARPYCHLAQLYRMNGKPDEARGLLLEAVRLDDSLRKRMLRWLRYTPSAATTTRHGSMPRAAEANGSSPRVELLKRIVISARRAVPDRRGCRPCSETLRPRD